MFASTLLSAIGSLVLLVGPAVLVRVVSTIAEGRIAGHIGSGGLSLLTTPTISADTSRRTGPRRLFATGGLSYLTSADEAEGGQDARA